MRPAENPSTGFLFNSAKKKKTKGYVTRDYFKIRFKILQYGSCFLIGDKKLERNLGQCQDRGKLSQRETKSRFNF